jgi:hypothetical protein
VSEQGEEYGRAVVVGRSLGFCQLGDGRQGKEWAHRLSRGRGGTWAPVNGLWLCSFHHRMTHQAHGLSRDCGWMVETGTHPSAVPALIVTQAGVGWWWLDELDSVTGRPTGLARLAESGEVPTGMWAGTFDDAVRVLHGRARAA